MTPIVRARDLSVTHAGPPEVRALVEVDLDLQPGDHLTITGRSGSGKTTLLNVLGLLSRPTSGTYELRGHPTADLGESDRAGLRSTDIGFVFQAFWLAAHQTAVDNVAQGLLYQGLPLRERRARAVIALERCGIGHRANFLPTQMSGGEQQRVAIARAIVADPPLLLCDEPTGDLDSASTGQILDLLDQQVAAGTTVVVITHDPEVAERGVIHRIMADGRLGP